MKWFWFGIFGLGLTATDACAAGEFLSDHYRLTYEHRLLVEQVAPTCLLISPLLVLVGSIGLSFTMPGRTAILLGMAVITLSLVSPLLLFDNPFLEIPNIHSWERISGLLIPIGLFSGVILIAVGSIRLNDTRHSGPPLYQ